jgi:amino acid transporter
MATKKNKTTHKHVPTLGTFGGVFTPSFLTILGIILFMRLGYVTGGAGLGGALLIVVLANSISIITSLSLAAIATNLKVKGGGPYYLISRTLGHEFGGSIGIVLYIAQSISIAFYCLGFGEALAVVLPEPFNDGQLIAGICVAVLFIFAWLGADWATNLQYLVMVILMASLASFFIGGFIHWDTRLLIENFSAPTDGLNFWFLFALFFPAVTGFTQGVNMSGDLKDPGVSIPLGTFLAVGLSMLVYFATTVVMAGSLSLNVLVSDYGAMNSIAIAPDLILAGVLAATLSSAMASYLGAPRILQSIAGDKLFSFLVPFAHGHGPARNPRRGVLLSTAIAAATIAVGQLNLIAPVVSMFFLISYGLINYATYFEASNASPSFRPLFKYYNSRLSLIGALACLGIMMTIDFKASIVAIAVLFGIYEYIGRVAPFARWSDGRRSYHLQRIRTHLLAADLKSEHPRDWRPNILLFVINDERRFPLFRFSSWLEANSGFTTVVKILQSKGVKGLKLRKEAEADLHQEIKALKLQAFPLAVSAPNTDVGIHTLIQGFGIGPLHANTLLLSWISQEQSPDSEHHSSLYHRHLITASRLGCNLVLLDDENKDFAAIDEVDPRNRIIDVWWWGGASSQLCLMLAYLMTRTEDWSGATIRLLAPCHKHDSQEIEDELKQTLRDVRIVAEVVLVNEVDAGKIIDHSVETDLVFMPFKLKQNKPAGLLDDKLEKFLPALPVTSLVLADKDFELDAEPEEGKAAEVAEAIDSLQDAKSFSEKTAKESEKILLDIAKVEAKLAALIAKDTDKEGIAKLQAELLNLEKQSEKLYRRAVRAKVKHESAEQEAEAAGIVTPSVEEKVDEGSNRQSLE